LNFQNILLYSSIWISPYSAFWGIQPVEIVAGSRYWE